MIEAARRIDELELANAELQNQLNNINCDQIIPEFKIPGA
jgi:hypothetical protein